MKSSTARSKAASTSAIKGLILTPTRELAAQCLGMMTAMAKFTGLRALLIVGGAKNVKAQVSRVVWDRIYIMLHNKAANLPWRYDFMPWLLSPPLDKPKLISRAIIGIVHQKNYYCRDVSNARDNS